MALRTAKESLSPQYNALGQRNLPAIERIVGNPIISTGCGVQPSAHQFVDVLLADITESGEVLDCGGPGA